MDDLSTPEHVASMSLRRGDIEHPNLGKCIHLRRLEISGDIDTIPPWVRKCTRLRSIKITSYTLATLPKWLAELQQLRSLWIDRASKLETIPEFVWELPRLEDLELFHTSVTELAGIEKAPALREVTSYSDREKGCGALGASFPAIAEALEGVKGIEEVVVKDSFGIPTLEIIRKTTIKLPKGTSKASAKKRALLLESLPRDFDCRGIDLAGQVFEDLDVQLDLREANLDGTVWRRCYFFHARMAGASAKAALFEDCTFEGGNSDMSGLKADGSIFRRCSISASLEKASLKKARIEDSKEDSFLRLCGASLRGAFVEGVFSTPKKGSYVDLQNADLRGAHVVVRLGSKAAARVAKSKTKLKWKEAKADGAKTDAKTKIEYLALNQAAPAKVEGPIAKAVGTLCGSNASCWFVVADAAVAKGWGGSQMDDEYNELPGTDFGRAMEKVGHGGKLAVGDGHGVLADVGDCGCTKLWKDGDSYCLLYAFEGDDVERNSKEGLKLIGSRVAQLEAKKTTKIGQFDVESGCMSLLLPYVKNPFTDKQIASAVKTGKVREVENDCDALLVPVECGRYAVTCEHLSHEDDVGQFFARIRIAPVRGEAKTAKKKTAKGRSFLFTGKLASMSRAEAKTQVTKLAYLQVRRSEV